MAHTDGSARLKWGLVEFAKEAARMDILSSVWKNKVSPIIDHLCNTDTCLSVWVLVVPKSSMCHLLLGLVPLKPIFHHFPWPSLIYAAPPLKRGRCSKAQRPVASERGCFLQESCVTLPLALLARRSWKTGLFCCGCYLFTFNGFPCARC